jgi:hypothetical protein
VGSSEYITRGERTREDRKNKIKIKEELRSHKDTGRKNERDRRERRKEYRPRM